MAVVETPVAAAAWPSAVATAIVAFAQPDQVIHIAAVVASVTIGVMFRRALAAGRGLRSVPMTLDLLAIAPLTIISLVAIRGLGLEVSWMATVAMAATVGNGGAPLAERWFKSNEASIPGVIPPADAISPRNASPDARRMLTERESPIAHFGSKITPSPGLPGRDPDQDVLDRLGDDG